jgi:hypothetical protein
MSEHKQWLDNEYSQWIKALQESTVHNFKEHPGVKRMLGEPDAGLFLPHIKQPIDDYLIGKILAIGCNGKYIQSESGVAWRMVYYAQQILSRNPSSICEIGGGVGQFYAILRAMGYKGIYWIIDLDEVEKFQRRYLEEVEGLTGLNTEQNRPVKNYDLIVSFYALGEFDNGTKQYYEPLIEKAEHGYIAFNPHSGASDSLSIFEKHDIKVTPGVEPGIKIIEW